ncbi:MAG: hypothetical protein JW901_05450 [Dehalococcoidia bacterium]|nr:hypothetical protein [Dehalococcoidia bacterium]
MPELLKVMEDWKGYQSSHEVKKPENYEQKLKEAVDLIYNNNRLAPHKRDFLVKEAMTTSDFPLLLADTLYRSMLPAYQAIDPEWKKYVRIDKVNKLFPTIGAKRFAITGANARLDKILEKGEYKLVTKGESKYDIYAYKYGAKFDISWEMMLSDDLGAFSKLPTEFAWAAANTEHAEVVGRYANDLGTHGAGNLYDNATAGEINAGVLPLTIDNLATTIALMQAFRDPGGIPIRNRPKYLVVSDGGLEFEARNILTSTYRMNVDSGGAFPMANTIAQYGLQLVVDPWLSILGTAGFTKNSWYLFADPTFIAAIEADYLEGHETPEICMKSSDKVSVSGAPMSPMSGDFESDNILYRIRDCFGANKLDWRATFLNTVAD